MHEFTIDASGGYRPSGISYFTNSAPIINGDWVEITISCRQTCTANDLDLVGLFISCRSTYYIEDIQLFKLAYGIDSYDSSTVKRMDPGQISL